MILADKIIEQRKKLGISQEELANKLGVSRQAVSKWEGAQSTPDLGRILQLSQLFGVSTDYLLKDDLGQAEYIDVPDQAEAVLRVSMAQANEFLSLKESVADKVAYAVFVCIISPVCLLLLSAASEYGIGRISENAAGAIGVIVLLAIVAVAVAVFIACGMKTHPYEFIEKETFETEYGVAGMVHERQSLYKDVYTRKLIMGICACILSVVPLLIAAFTSENEFVLISMVCLLLFIVGIGVILIISSSLRWESMEQLLQEGSYSSKEKKDPGVKDAVSTAYWLIVVAAFLAYSFISADWSRSWIIWPVAGVLYGAVAAVCGIFKKK